MTERIGLIGVRGSNGTEMHAKAESMGIQGKSRVGNAYHPIDSPNTNYSTANQI